MIKLSKRLSAIYDSISACSTVIDVGTDHAHIPIACIQSGKAEHGIALDIRKGPLEIAAKNVAGYKAADKIRLVQTDGLSSIEIMSNDCIVIAGIGGLETICILSKAGKIPCRMVLQPQRSSYELREFLDKNGYSVIEESIVSENGKFYNVIVSRYSGISGEMTRLEKYAGKNIVSRVKNITCRQVDEALIEYLEHLVQATKKKIRSDPSLRELLTELDNIIGTGKDHET